MTYRRISPMILVAMLAACGGTVDSFEESDVSTEIYVDILPEPVSELPPDPSPDPIPDPSPDFPSDITADPGTGSGEVGAPCSADGQCSAVAGPDAFCLTAIGGWISFPGGYCSAYCTDDGPCAPGGRCIVMYSYGLCLEPCTAPDQCRTAEGYTCSAIPYITDDTYCVPMM